jgi:hypothetical protein
MIIRLRHANLPDTIVEVETSTIFAKWFSKAHKATHVLATGGAIVPVLESVEEINRLMTGKTPAEGSSTNGNEEG